MVNHQLGKYVLLFPGIGHANPRKLSKKEDDLQLPESVKTPSETFTVEL